MKEAEQLESSADYHSFLFNEIMKNEFVREEFEKIREEFGEEAYELNKMSLINFIKRGKQNYTYAVKYYGINDGQIGILSRKVPFEEWQREQSLKLPNIVSEPPKKKEIYEYVEIEQSEEEEYSEEIEVSDEEFVPTVSKPANINIVQGSVGGKEFDNIQRTEELEKPLEVAPIPKKTKKIKKKRKVKRKKMVKKLKQQVQ